MVERILERLFGLESNILSYSSFRSVHVAQSGRRVADLPEAALAQELGVAGVAAQDQVSADAEIGQAHHELANTTSLPPFIGSTHTLQYSERLQSS